MADDLALHPHRQARLGGRHGTVFRSKRQSVPVRAAKGAGEAIALRLAAEGANIVISDIGKPADPATPQEHIGATDEMEGDCRRGGGGISAKPASLRRPRSAMCAISNRCARWPDTLSIRTARLISGSTMPYRLYHEAAAGRDGPMTGAP